METQLLIPTLLLGGMFTFFGWVMKSQNAGDMVNGFDEKKHDRKKVSKIMGGNLLAVGISVFVIGGIGLFFGGEYIDFFLGIQTAVVVIGVIKAVYKTNKYGKITK